MDVTDDGDDGEQDPVEVTCGTEGVIMGGENVTVNFKYVSLILRRLWYTVECYCIFWLYWHSCCTSCLMQPVPQAKFSTLSNPWLFLVWKVDRPAREALEGKAAL